MSEQIIHRAARVTDARAAMPWLVAAGIYALLIALAPRLLADPDTYSHIALGRWIFDHHAVPTADPLSLTMRGTPWIAFEWGSQVVYAAAYALGGWLAVVAIAAAAAAAAFGQLTRFLLRTWQPMPVIIAVLAALVLVSPHILARPHVLALPLLVTWVASLIQAAEERRAPSWWLLAIMVLWANLHGSYSFGLAMIVPIACEALWSAPPAERMRVARQWILFAALALAAACCNPYGPEMILVTFRTAALGTALSTITEWRPQDFSHLAGYELIMLAGFAVALYRGVRLPFWRLVMVFGVLHLSLSQQRHADLLGLLAPLLIAKPLAEQFAALAASRDVESARSGVIIPAAAIALLIAITGLSAERHDIAPAADITPANALKAIDLAKAGPILNDYDFGGYLDFVGIAPFIDGRGELYGAAFINRYSRDLNLQNIPDFQRLLDEYKIETTLLSPSTPAVALLDRLPGWRRVYADDVAVVHQRVKPRK
ncbi:MAG TPA: hypothetical protein VHV56_08660 [Pseudolabrys sp.]|nr:hypothetical protein [Pseudolabrys sp.]